MISYFLFALGAYLGLFALVRLVLLMTALGGPSAHDAAVPASALAMSFLVGLRFDLAVSLYAIGPLFLLNAPFYVAGREGKVRGINRAYLASFFLFFAFLGAVEREFFAYFHERLNGFALDWGDDPGFVLRMIWETYPVVPVFLLLGLLLWLYLRAARSVEQGGYGNGTERGTAGADPASSPARRALVVLIALSLIFLGARGTIHHKSPLRWGHAYFSTYHLADQLALNGIFTLIDSYRSSGMGVRELRETLGIVDPHLAYEVAGRLTNDGSGRVLRFPLREYTFTEPERRLNVVIVLLESFSQAEIDRHKARGVPLYFNDLQREGISFTRFYSNGFHTSMGLFSALFGMPNVHGKSILKRGEGRQTFSGIVNVLSSRGWRTLFGVSHDPNFDNMAGFLRGNGVERVISEFDFDRSEVLSTLGVADHRLFERMIEAFDETDEPFLGVVLTTNNHGPWVIPEVPGRTFLSTFDYTDWALRHFLDLAEREPWFARTLFVITADHGGAIDPVHDLDLQSFHVPCLIYAPGIVEPRVVETVGGHIDLTETILGLLRVDHRTVDLGRDLLASEGSRSLTPPEKPPGEERQGGSQESSGGGTRGEPAARVFGAPGIEAFGSPAGWGNGFALVQERETLGLVRDGWYLIDRIGGRTSLYRIGGKRQGTGDPGCVGDLWAATRGPGRRGEETGRGAGVDTSPRSALPESIPRVGGSQGLGSGVGPGPAPSNPEHDWAPEMPEFTRGLRDAARAYYFVANDMILNLRAQASAYDPGVTTPEEASGLDEPPQAAGAEEGGGS